MIERMMRAAGMAALLMASASAAQAGFWDFLKRGDTAEAVRPPVVQVQSLDADRFNRLEAQMRTLTGQVEELQFQLRQLQDILQRMQADSDFRFRELEGGTAAPVQQSTAPALPAPQTGSQGGSQAILTADNAAPPPLPGADNGGPRPLDLSALASGNAGAALPTDDGIGRQIAAIGPSGDPRTDYQRGYDMIIAGDYIGAEQTFRQFLTTYPQDQLAADAQFWIGESYFARGRYREAADEFLAGYKAYPQSAKGADTLLKLGLSLAGLGEREAACRTYDAVLKQYPQASNALRQRIISEQAVAAC